MRYKEIDNFNASMICQRNLDRVEETLSYMENNLKLIQSRRTIKKKYYTFTREVYSMIEKDTEYNRDKRLDREAIKMRMLSILKERNLTNTDIRQMIGMERLQVVRFMKELEEQRKKEDFRTFI